MTISPPRERKEGTVASAEMAEVSDASSVRTCEASVSPENRRLDPFISLRI